MTVIFVLIGVSICLAVFFLIAFLWAVKNGQYEDDITPSVRMLMDDPPKTVNQNSNNSSDGSREV